MRTWGKNAGVGERASVSRALVLVAAFLCAGVVAFAVAGLEARSASAQGVVQETFAYTGAAQTWTVPAGVTEATFEVYGAQGGVVTARAPTSTL